MKFFKKLITFTDEYGRILYLRSPVLKTFFSPNEFGEIFLFSENPVTDENRDGIWCVNEKNLAILDQYDGEIFEVVPIKGSRVVEYEHGIRAEIVKVIPSRSVSIEYAKKYNYAERVSSFIDETLTLVEDGDKIIAVRSGEKIYFPQEDGRIELRFYRLDNKTNGNSGVELKALTPVRFTESGVIFGDFVFESPRITVKSEKFRDSIEYLVELSKLKELEAKISGFIVLESPKEIRNSKNELLAVSFSTTGPTTSPVVFNTIVVGPERTGISMKVESVSSYSRLGDGRYRLVGKFTLDYPGVKPIEQWKRSDFTQYKRKTCSSFILEHGKLRRVK